MSHTVVFIESWWFTRRLRELARGSADDLLLQIQQDLLKNPERGDVVKGLGGIRKARVPNTTRRKGKRGGYRYLYLYLEHRDLEHRDHIQLLFLLDKDEPGDLTDKDRKAVRQMVTELKALEEVTWLRRR
jgi:hypothetical protein